MDNEVNIQDLIALSYEQKPVDFEQAFNSLITDRVAQAVENRKTEIAQSMFGAPVNQDPEPPEDNVDTDDTTDDSEPEDLNFDDEDLETPEEPEDGEIS